MDVFQLDWAIVAIIGISVGAGELVSRYRDAPFSAITTRPAIFYLLINGGAALIALSLIRAFGWTFGVSEQATTGANSTVAPIDAVRWVQILVAGSGAITLLRSSLFTYRVGDQDVALGPSIFLKIILDAADRGIDRVRAQARARMVHRAMRGVAFESSHSALPTYCLALMQNLSQVEQDQLSLEITNLRNAQDIPMAIKSLILGLSLSNVVGEGVLRSAVTTLRDYIAETTPTDSSGL